MKRLTCDICGGIGLIKQDGVFVCQTCYTKYSVEEVKRMMSDEFDNSALSIRKESNVELNNLIILAERAFNESNYASAEKYYDDILRIDPNNWKANFFRSYCFTMQSRIINLTSNYSMTVNTAVSTIQMLIDKGNLEFLNAYQIIHEYLGELACIVIINKGDIYLNFPEKVLERDYIGIVNIQNENGFLNFISEIHDVILSIIRFQSIILESDIITEDLILNMLIKLNKISITSQKYIYNNPYSINDLFYDTNQEMIIQINDALNNGINSLNNVKERISERKRQEKIRRQEQYWNENSDLKKKLESEKNDLRLELASLKKQSAPYDSRIQEIKKERDETIVPSRKEKYDIEDKIELLSTQQAKFGFFKGKEKKKLELQINELKSHLHELEDSIQLEEQEIRENCNTKIESIEEEMKPLKDKMLIVQRRINEIEDELNMDR